MTASPEDGPAGFAEVAVDGAGWHARTFSYSIPAGMNVRPGHLVWAPFGPRVVQGLVMWLAQAPQVEKTREILHLAHPEPLLTPGQLRLAQWVAGYYRAGLFLCASTMLPPGFASRLRTYVSPDENRVVEAENAGTLRPREQRAIRWAREAGSIRREALGRKLGRGGEALVDSLARRKLLTARSQWEEPRVKARRENVLRLNVTHEHAQAEAVRLEASQKSGNRQAALLRAVLDEGEVRQADAARTHGRYAVDRLKSRGFLRVVETQVERDPLAGYRFTTSTPPEPTAAQAGALEAIGGALERSFGPDASVLTRRSERFLLYGVTGSGKTEVYLRAAEKCLSLGRGVIVLAPEIALTAQTLARFASRFPGQVALLHSGIPDGERFDQWWRIHGGELPLVLGSRGAVFSPVPNPGLVVIDEQHEWTYKQHDAAPRYHAVAAAEELCRLHGATLLAGSATPDVETFRRAMRGEYHLLRLPRRIGIEQETGRFTPVAGAEGPALRVRRTPRTSAGQAGVRIVDMRRELIEGHTGMFSRTLEYEMTEALRAGGRIILFLNRRGSASFLQCRRCGAVPSCRRCDTALTLHRGEAADERDSLVCHYCGYRVRPPRACEVCGDEHLRPMGLGTQAVAAEARKLFPGADVLRWDRDTARSAAQHFDLLDRFLKGNSRILVGTQMVAKGLDIPEVTLVGVVLADIGLAVPDFRAGERAFQVLTQVAGRSGRGEDGGAAIIQTFQPDHYAVQAAAEQDYEAFYETEMALRAEHADPPFTRLVKLSYSDYDPERSWDEAKRMADALNQERLASGDTGVEVLGPTPSFPHRMRGLMRWHLLLKGARPESLLDRVPPGRDWVVDVDPITVS